jgi:hypothetical protein
MLNSTTTIIIVLGLFGYFIYRQFTEQPLKPLMLLLFPLVVLYVTYDDVIKVFANPVINVALAAALMLIGLLLGGVLGWYRGGLARMRLDYTTQTVLVKATALSIGLWFVLLLIKVAVGAVFYTGWMHSSLLVIGILSLASPLFLGNVLAEKSHVFLRSLNQRAERKPITSAL